MHKIFSHLKGFFNAEFNGYSCDHTELVRDRCGNGEGCGDSDFYCFGDGNGNGDGSGDGEGSGYGDRHGNGISRSYDIIIEESNASNLF